VADLVLQRDADLLGQLLAVGAHAQEIAAERFHFTLLVSLAAKVVDHHEPATVDVLAEIQNFRVQVDDLRSERERWRIQAEQITRLLTDQREKEQAKKPGFLAWLSGK